MSTENDYVGYNAPQILGDYLKSCSEAANFDFKRELPFVDGFKVFGYTTIIWIIGQILKKHPDILTMLVAGTEKNRKYVNEQSGK